MKKFSAICLILLLTLCAAAESVTCDTKDNGAAGLPVTWTVDGTPVSFAVYPIGEEAPVLTAESSEKVFTFTPDRAGQYVLVCTLDNGDLLVSGIVHVNETLLMGTFEQDGKADTADPIEWTVLTAQDGKALLISKYILHNNSYFNPWWIKFKYTYWAKSYVGDYSENYYSSQPKDPSRLYRNISADSIPLEPVNGNRNIRGTEEDLYLSEIHCRYWCNEMFYRDAFTEEEKARILLTHNENPDNEQFHIGGGPDTDDYVFFLSYPEVLAYMPTDASRKTTQTTVARYEGKHVNDGNYWWLRTPGNWPYQAMMVYGSNGRISMSGADVGHSQIGYRPCIWIKIGG